MPVFAHSIRIPEFEIAIAEGNRYKGEVYYIK